MGVGYFGFSGAFRDAMRKLLSVLLYNELMISEAGNAQGNLKNRAFDYIGIRKNNLLR